MRTGHARLEFWTEDDETGFMLVPREKNGERYVDAVFNGMDLDKSERVDTLELILMRDQLNALILWSKKS